jgi:hypothetical protein
LGRSLALTLTLAAVTASSIAQPREEPTSALGSALKSAVTLFQDLKRAWDDKVAFPASKEQLALRLDKLAKSLAELRGAKANLTEKILAEAKLAGPSDSELMWEQREQINIQIRQVMTTVQQVQGSLSDLLPLLPAALTRQGGEVIAKLDIGLHEKWTRLGDISQQLTGRTQFDPERIQREGDEAVQIATELLQAVSQFRLAVKGDLG